eukprot:1336610-Rhodomonas_salina.6
MSETDRDFAGPTARMRTSLKRPAPFPPPANPSRGACVARIALRHHDGHHSCACTSALLQVEIYPTWHDPIPSFFSCHAMHGAAIASALSSIPTTRSRGGGASSFKKTGTGFRGMNSGQKVPCVMQQ